MSVCNHVYHKRIAAAALPERTRASPAVHAGVGFERRVCVALGAILIDCWLPKLPANQQSFWNQQHRLFDDAELLR